MDVKQINKICAEIDMKSRRYFQNEKYVTGHNPILDEETKKKPDNKIPTPLAKTAIEDLAGYAGKPGAISTSYDNVTTEGDESKDKILDDYENLNKQFKEHNNEKNLNAELYTECISQGVAYELFWTSDDMQLSGGVMTPEFAMVPGSEIMVETDGSLKPKITRVFRKYRTNEIDYLDIYMPLYSERWERQKDKEWVRNEDGDTTYPYTSVPIAVYKANRREQCLFDAEKHIINAFDSIISQSVNEVNRFNAAIALFDELLNAETKEAFNQGKISIIDQLKDLDGSASDRPKYLEKNLSGVSEFYNTLADRLINLFRTSTKVPDFTQLQMGSDASGLAMAYKILGLEFRAGQVEANFNEGLKMRQNLLNQVISAGTSAIKTDDYKLNIKWERNLPMNREQLITMAMNLKALNISKEVYLKLIPEDIIDDIEKEIARQDAATDFDIIPAAESDI